ERSSAETASPRAEDRGAQRLDPTDRSSAETASPRAEDRGARRLDPTDRSSSTTGEPAKAARFTGNSAVVGRSASHAAVAVDRRDPSASQPNTVGRVAASAEEPRHASAFATTTEASALAEELAAVRAIRATVEASRPADDAIARYRATYPDGTLRIEVEALAV